MNIATGVITCLIHSMIISFMLGRLLIPRKGFLISSPALTAGMTAFFTVLMLSADISSGIGTALAKLLCIPAAAWLLHRGSSAERLKLSLLGITLTAASEAAAYALSEALSSGSQGLSDPAARVFSSDVMLMLTLAAVLIADREKIAREKLKTLLFLVLGFDLIHLLFLVFNYLTDESRKPDVNGLIQASFQTLLFSIFFVHYFTVLRMRRLSEKEKELESIRREIEYNRRYYALADLQYKDISRLRHDIQNHFLALKELLGEQEEGQAEARNIIISISNRLDALGTLDFCTNRRVNALLTVKLNDKSLSGISVNISLKDTDRCTIDDNDLCGIISELFDCAAESCRRLGQNTGAEMELISKLENEHFVLRMSCSFPNKEPIPDFEVSRLISQSCKGSFDARLAEGRLTTEAVIS